MPPMLIDIKIEPTMFPIKKYANWDKLPKQFLT